MRVAVTVAVVIDVAITIAAALSGCAPSEPLTEVPITGGTDEQRAAVYRGLAAFDAATGGGRTRLSRVRFRPLDGVGRFDRTSRAVALDDALTVDQIDWVLRHELCHALETSEPSLMRRGDPLYESLAAGLFASDAWLIDGTRPPRSQARREREAFAVFCAIDPWIAHAVAEPCASDPSPDASAAFARLVDDVWLGDAPLPPPAAALEGEVELGYEPAAVDAYGTTDPRVFVLAWPDADTLDDAVLHHHFFDVITGLEIGLRNLRERQAPLAVPPGLPRGPEVSDIVGASAGPTAATVEVPLYHLGSVRRRAWTDGSGAWWPVGDGCDGGLQFFADERLYDVRVDGERIGWAPMDAR